MFGLFLFWILLFKDVQPGLFFIRIFRVLNTVQSFIFKVHAVAHSQQQLFKYTTVAFVCQQLFLFFFWTFWSSLPPFSAASYIISNLPTNVNSFFQFFYFFVFSCFMLLFHIFCICLLSHFSSPQSARLSSLPYDSLFSSQFLLLYFIEITGVVLFHRQCFHGLYNLFFHVKMI